MGKYVAYALALAMVVSVCMFSGCVEKKPVNPGVSTAQSLTVDTDFSKLNVETQAYPTITEESANELASVPVGELRTYTVGGETFIASYNVMQFGAKGDGKTNNAKAFLQAITAAKNAGGGVVYVPAGTYYLKGRFEIPTGVTLRGSWTKEEGGTLILVEPIEGLVPQPYLTMTSSSALKNLSFYYVGQNFAQPVEFAPTVGIKGNPTGIELCDLMFYNSWEMICFSKGSTGMTSVDNVYGTPLSLGIIVDCAPDLNRIMGFDLRPDYYALCGFPGAPTNGEEVKVLVNWMFENTVGLVSERIDWHCVYDYTCAGMKVGMWLRNSTQPASPTFKGPPSGYMYKFTMEGCQTGILMDDSSAAGFQFSLGKINCPVSRESVAIRLGEGFETYMSLNSVHVTGFPVAVIQSEGSGIISAVDCAFDNWTGEAAWTLAGGTASAVRCSFGKAAQTMSFDKKVRSAMMLGCLTQAGTPEPETASLKKWVVSDDCGEFPSLNQYDHPAFTGKAEPASKNIVLASDYGVTPEAEDITQGLQNALNAAAQQGGGYVYLPVGVYHLRGSVKVPTGVELRGAMDMIHHPSYTMGTAFYIYGGNGNENASATIELEAHAGVTGITFYYPDQGYFQGSYIEYPWLIRGLGEGVYVRYVHFVNVYNGIDFGTYKSDGHFVEYLMGQTIRRGIFVGNNSTEGWLQNIHFVPHSMHSPLVDNKPDMSQASTWPKISNGLMEQNEFYIFGDTNKEYVFNCCSFGSLNATLFVEQNGRGANVEALAYYVDSSRCAVRVEKAGSVNFYSSDFIVYHLDTNENVQLQTNEGSTGKLTFINCEQHGPNVGSAWLKGCDVTYVQHEFFEPGGKLADIQNDATCRIFAGTVRTGTIYKTEIQTNLSLVGNILHGSTVSGTIPGFNGEAKNNIPTWVQLVP